MVQLSRELAKKAWKSNEIRCSTSVEGTSRTLDSDSSDMLSPEVSSHDADPTPSQGLTKHSARGVARRLEFAESDSEDNGSDADLEMNGPPTKQPTSRTSSTDRGSSDKDQASAGNKKIDQTLALLLEEVKKTNTEISTVSLRLQSVEKRLEVIEEDGITSSSSADSAKRKRKVPNKVRQEFREVYKSLQEDDKIEGFDVKKRYVDKHNQDIIDRVVKEVKGVDSAVPTFQIREAGKRFFHTKLEEESLKSRGKYDEKVIKQRKRNRLTRKRDGRLATLMKTSSVSTENKEKWKEILTIDFMSSEESGIEDNLDGSQRHVLYVSDLCWRADNVTSFLHRLDEKGAKKKSKKSEMQTRPRISKGLSDRAKPQVFPENHWAFRGE